MVACWFFSSEVLLCTPACPPPRWGGDPSVPSSALPRSEILMTGSGLEPRVHGTEWHKGGGWSCSAGIILQLETPNHFCLGSFQDRLIISNPRITQKISWYASSYSTFKVWNENKDEMKTNNAKIKKRKRHFN